MVEDCRYRVWRRWPACKVTERRLPRQLLKYKGPLSSPRLRRCRRWAGLQPWARLRRCPLVQGVDLYARLRGNLQVLFRQGAEERVSAPSPCSMHPEAAVGTFGTQRSQATSPPRTGLTAEESLALAGVTARLNKRRRSRRTSSRASAGALFPRRAVSELTGWRP